MSVLFYEIGFLNAEVCEKFCIFSHISGEFNSCWLVTNFRDNFVCDEETSLSQEEVQKVENCILEQLPTNYTEKMTFHLDDLVVSVGVLSCRIKTLGTWIFHLDELG